MVLSPELSSYPILLAKDESCALNEAGNERYVVVLGSWPPAVLRFVVSSLLPMFVCWLVSLSLSACDEDDGSGEQLVR